MKLCIGFIYNELEWLPKKVKYCKDNGLDLYIIDNYSTDGSSNSSDLFDGFWVWRLSITIALTH